MESNKGESNLKKHKIRFDRAADVFRDPMMLTIFDEIHSQTEDRWITMDQDRNNMTLVVVHTYMEIDPSNVNIRIISARRATKKESHQYHSR